MSTVQVCTTKPLLVSDDAHFSVCHAQNKLLPTAINTRAVHAAGHITALYNLFPKEVVRGVLTSPGEDLCLKVAPLPVKEHAWDLTKSKALIHLFTSLAGRIAEERYFLVASAGSAGDIARANSFCQDLISSGVLQTLVSPRKGSTFARLSEVGLLSPEQLQTQVGKLYDDALSIMSRVDLSDEFLEEIALSYQVGTEAVLKRLYPGSLS